MNTKGALHRQHRTREKLLARASHSDRLMYQKKKNCFFNILLLLKIHINTLYYNTTVNHSHIFLLGNNKVYILLFYCKYSYYILLCHF